MELMPASERWAMEKGIKEGKIEGKKEGKKEGAEMERRKIIRRLLDNGYDLEKVAETLGYPLDEVRKAAE